MILAVSIVHIIVCLMLIAIILLQPGRGMGLSNSAFADSSAQSVFGTKTADVLTKATTVAAILFMLTCIGLSALTAHKSRSLYSNFKNQAPITMDQIQKAVKEAETKAAPATATAEVTTPTLPADSSPATTPTPSTAGATEPKAA